MESKTDFIPDEKEMKEQNQNRLKGMKIRGEFLCPITYELLREPVVLADGHTYEKISIEKWLKSHKTSPLTLEILPYNTLTPNINLKKLIQDLINEGGSGLYMHDVNDKSRQFDIVQEKVLVLKCLGPPESDWNNKSFQVTSNGCLGGRKQTDDKSKQQEFILFKDSAVSRTHFEIIIVEYGKYGIRDLGSAGGTFIRIPFNQRKELQPGIIILIGKHQFTVSSIDDSNSIMGDSVRSNNNVFINDNINDDIGDSINRLYHSKKCTLTCFAPDGSPLQGKSFLINSSGSSIGRKKSNDIALISPLQNGDNEEIVVNIDTAVSSEHCRVEMDKDTGRFYICDGTSKKSSTNGTWFRLSGPQQESPIYRLNLSDEILIGTVRFQVSDAGWTISEKSVQEEK